MKIGIRADGGSKIGMGHVMRTLVLAKELCKNNEVFYICKHDKKFSAIYNPGVDRIRDSGFPAKEIKENNILEELSNIKADILITDSYDVDEIYFNETKKMFKHTVYIDDMNKHYFNIDVLINQNINARDLNYKVNHNTKLLLGPEYTMIRKEFRNLPEKLIGDKVEDILITVGGADPNDVTGRILSYVQKLDFKFHVVVGPSFNNISNLKKYEKNNIKLYFNANMFELMQKCDLAISACGSTLYELSSSGVPTLGIIIADNQIGIGTKFHDMDIVDNLGWYKQLNKEKFLFQLNKIINDKNMRQRKSKLGRNLIDGNGVKRIKGILEELYIQV
ncbi:UDP-2,4-diacetamido-2,4,6-trideoxy-beta-L-altropyranose hydrolase [Hathewaya massiliensis]|uniref:UDP-2,4-diacetamido-2,4, 6-trideoxy-beta-L-altropyranose hydrolase n=1 Tax=Hathewaya massiliensis TaxID=1964382 RepID=UPI001158B95C|nr:UDP-2,4-diacetamido-2,4,6-trideoxy-beta-L-altropyranose hydrolase [Hathewaya massiliensis]